MPVNEEFKNISCVSDYLYSEYLYVLKKDNFLQIRDELEKQSLTLDHYTAITEDHTSFYLYLDNEDEDATSESDEIYGIDNEDISILNAMLSEDDEPAAMLNLNHTPSYSTIYGVFVDEDKRNKGLGFSLLFDTLDEFFNEYDKPLILNVTSTNIPALKLYKKAGFIKTSQVDYYAITSPMS
jgi:ribosomal protein S18 acetylase RimI-like enzyme